MKPLSNFSKNQWARRDFLKVSAATALGLAFSRLPAMAGPFTRADFDHLVPADKKLSPDWVKSLFERGTPEVLRGNELKFVGMPIGGIGAGQLYLGGDGRLWHWDIFNQHVSTGAEHYAKPVTPSSPLTQRFSLKLGDKIVALDRDGFADVSFRGEYPVGTVEYKDSTVPVEVKLAAFSPFIPLNADDSSLPATVFQYTVHNPTATSVTTTLTGELENGICLFHRNRSGILKNSFAKTNGATLLVCSAQNSATSKNSPQPDLVFEDWNRPTYDTWTAEGTAFGSGPVRKTEIPSYQGDVGGDTTHVVNSHASAPGDSIEAKDGATGKLISREFVIERNFIAFWIGGGKAKGNSRLGLSLMIEGKPVLTASGKDDNRMSLQYFEVGSFAGKTAHLEIVDDATGSWGNVGVGKITFTDERGKTEPIDSLSDYGTMSLALLGDADETSGDQSAGFSEKLIGSLGHTLTLASGEAKTVTFVLTWYFPNLSIKNSFANCGRYYATKFSSAQAVAEYVAKNFPRLEGQTKLWRDNWYDSTLPFWLLDRTHLNISILATSTAYRFANGRFYGWEGVGCCAGTCTHVWQYEQAMGRLFPELDISLRERADFNPAISFKPDGMIDHRGEFHAGQAVDGQAGTLLRAYRDHQMSPDNTFLKRNYASIKKAMGWLIKQDGNADGILEGAQHNTLDAEWYGPVAWLSSLYLASLRAVAEMAADMGDDTFATECRTIADAGSINLVARLFDGNYFINKVDPRHLDSINSGTGCEIDQVFGQSWAFQVGLPRVLPKLETVTALKSLWRYNFSPDVGPYREVYKPGRWYAMPGEAGLLICTFPRRDWDYAQAKGKGAEWAAGYFDECMNGFEHQVAGHMIWEGLVLEGLAVERAVHDRYHASRRNPWNEVECGDHYARSMASYGVFIAACGFEHHGPKGHIGFAPKLTPENFKCAFTSAKGWGSYAQKLEGGNLTAEISVHWGNLELNTIALASESTTSAKVQHAGQSIATRLTRNEQRVLLTFENSVVISTGEKLEVNLA